MLPFFKGGIAPLIFERSWNMERCVNSEMQGNEQENKRVATSVTTF